MVRGQGLAQRSKSRLTCSNAPPRMGGRQERVQQQEIHTIDYRSDLNNRLLHRNVQKTAAQPAGQTDEPSAHAGPKGSSRALLRLMH